MQSTITDEAAISELFGNIDIYLFDQLLRGRVRRGMSVLDAGCGSGRNLRFFLRAGYEVYGADRDPAAIAAVRQLAAGVGATARAENFRVEQLENMSFPDGIAEFVVSSAVLHFAQDDNQFDAMLRGTWRVLMPGGVFFCRLASSIGMQDRIRRVSGHRFLLPDGTERYLVDEALLMKYTAELGGELLDPLKTTVVQNQRCMTTWVVRKRA